MRLWLRTIVSIWLVSLGISGAIMAFLIFARIEDFPNGLIWKVFLLLGLVSTSLGIYLYVGTHKTIDGIRINPKWITYFYDFINLLFGILAAFLFLNFILVQLKMNTIEDEQFSLFMGVYYFILGIPFVAFFTTRLAGQVIKVSDESIESAGMGNLQIMPWNNIKEIKLKDDYIVTPKSGIVYRRRIQNKMIIESDAGDRLIINEPQTKKAKTKLYQTLKSHIPDHLKSNLEEVFSKWR